MARGLAGREIYHIINRGNRRAEVFHNEEDYEKFIELMCEAKKLTNYVEQNPKRAKLKQWKQIVKLKTL